MRVHATGLAVDLTSTQVPVLHPNPEKGDLPPSPVLIVATSDAQLRFFTLGCADESAAVVVHPPQPVPQPGYLQAVPAQVWRPLTRSGSLSLSLSLAACLCPLMPAPFQPACDCKHTS